MALTEVTPTVLVLNTPSASLLDAAMTAITHAVDGCTIPITTEPDLSTYHATQVLIKLEDSAGCTVTFQEGDNPPAIRSGSGAAFTVALGANEVKYIVIELARFMQDDGTVHFATATTTASCSCFILPRGA